MYVSMIATVYIALWSIAYLVDGGKLGDLWPVKDSEGQANHLQVLAAGGCGNVSRLGAHIVDDRLLEPWNEEVGALVDDAFANTAQTVEDDRAVAALDIVEGSLGKTDAGGKRDGEAVDGVESVGGHYGVSVVVDERGTCKQASCITLSASLQLRFDDAGVVRASTSAFDRCCPERMRG